MKLLKIGALVLALSASKAEALVDLNVFGGYATFKMASMNQTLNDTSKNLIGYGFSSSSTTPYAGGWMAGADAAFSLMPFLKIGPRVELLQPSQAKVTGESGGGKVTFSQDLSLFTAMLGVSFDQSLPLTGLALRVGAFGGYGSATGNLKLDSSVTGINSETAGLSGNGIVGEFVAGIRYDITGPLDLALEGSYRTAQLASMNADKTTSNLGTTAGKPATDNANNPQTYDFGGLGLTLGLNFNF